MSLFRYDDDANDDPDYQQPASMSQKDEDMDDEDDKVTLIFCFLNGGAFLTRKAQHTWETTTDSTLYGSSCCGHDRFCRDKLAIIHSFTTLKLTKK